MITETEIPSGPWDVKLTMASSREDGDWHVATLDGDDGNQYEKRSKVVDDGRGRAYLVKWFLLTTD